MLFKTELLKDRLKINSSYFIYLLSTALGVLNITAFPLFFGGGPPFLAWVVILFCYIKPQARSGLFLSALIFSGLFSTFLCLDRATTFTKFHYPYRFMDGIFTYCLDRMVECFLKCLPLTVHLLLFSLLWGSGEWLRGHLLSGIPWSLFSYIGLFNEVWVQSASLWGSSGLVIPMVFVFTSPALILLKPRAVSSSSSSCLVFY